MGLTWNTDMAYYGGHLISVADALYIQQTEGEQALKGKLNHAIDRNLPVKFVHSEKKEDYFAVVANAKWSEEDKKAYANLCKEHPLHVRAIELIENFQYVNTNDSFICLDGIPVSRSEIISCRGDGHRLYVDELGYLIPDATISLKNMNYYIEIKNEHKVSNDKLLKYKAYRKISTIPFKVIEIDISDIVKKAHEEHSLDFDNLLLERIQGNSDKKVVLDLSEPKKEIETEEYFGRCTYCGTPYELATNKSDEAYDPKVSKSSKVHVIKLRAKSIPEEDYLSFGGAMLHCPKCVENRYKTLYCPDCLTLRGNPVALKLLRNDNKGIYLECPNRPTTKKLGHGEDFPEETRCDFSLTVIDTKDDWDFELKNIKNFFNLFKISSATRTRKRQKAHEEVVKKNKSWK